MISQSLATGAVRLNARRRVPALVLMTDLARLPDPVAAAGQLPRGAAVILRDAGHPARLELGNALAQLAQRRGLILLVSGDAELAISLHAHGLHLPEADMHRAPDLRRRHPRWLITGAAHSRAAINKAGRLGLDAVLLSPVFATASHPGGTFLGPLRFHAITRGARIPVLALGGVDAATVGRLPAGTPGIAAIGALAAGIRPSLLSRRWRGSPLCGGRGG